MKNELIKISKMSGKLEKFLSINTNNLDIDFCKRTSNLRNKQIKINPDKLKLFDIIFNVVDKPYLDKHKKVKYNCNRHCIECLKCYKPTNKKQIIIEKLKDNFKTDPEKKLICNYCYAKKNLETYRKNCIPCYQKNNNVLSSDIIKKDQLPKIDKEKYPYVRFNSYGELINMNHLINLINICKINPDIHFSLYTKRFNLVNNYFKNHKKPKNLVLVYSNPNINNILKF